MRGDLLVIEGLDGVGKSTVGAQLADRLGYAYFDSVPEPYRKHLPEFQQAIDSDSFYLMMLSMLKHLSGKIAAIRDSGDGVVVTRYYQTTICYHNARHKRLGLESSVSILPSSLKLEEHSHGYFLYANEDVRVGRMRKRGALSVDDNATLDENFRAILLGEYSQYPFTNIDVTNITPDKAVDLIAQNINQAPRRPAPGSQPINKLKK